MNGNSVSRLHCVGSVVQRSVDLRVALRSRQTKTFESTQIWCDLLL